MYRLSDNYYHRKCYFAREQVPTQTVMKNIMTKPLAEVYFKSMNMNLKIKAGLEPPLKGGGNEWYQPPEEQLAGRAVLKPVSIAHLKMLGFDGLNNYGDMVKQVHYQCMQKEMCQALENNDAKWKKAIVVHNRKYYEELGTALALENSSKIRNAIDEFELMYRSSVSKIETIVMEAAEKEISRIEQDAYDNMNERYKQLLRVQVARMLKDYDDNLDAKKAEFKAKFKKDVEELRTEKGIDIKNIIFEKHLTIEKLRHFMQCRNLACAVYVALKEKEEEKVRLDKIKYDHKKIMEAIKTDIQIKDLEIDLEAENYKKQEELIQIWKIKICHVLKKFQLFVGYCLKLLPEQAEFFLNLEKLMLLQLAEAAENPETESKIEYKEYKAPVARPHPCYLVCDKDYKPAVEQRLCPHHCTSSASQFPVLIINKQCIYTACDNFDVYYDKIKNFIYGGVRGDDADFEDNHAYELDVPVKYTSATNVQELLLESSLMQILQNEKPNIRKLPVECGICKLSYCFCNAKGSKTSKILPVTNMSIQELPKQDKPESIHKKLTKASILQLQREPKWESYLKYVEPTSCKCAKIAKKHLMEHLPPYMKNTSPFEHSMVPNYEKCTIEGFKRAVRKARTMPESASRFTPSVENTTPGPGVMDMGTQYSDPELDYLCTCYSDDEASKFRNILDLATKKSIAIQSHVVDSLIASDYMEKTWSTFATDRAFSLRNLIDDDSDLQEIFKSETCK